MSPRERLLAIGVLTIIVVAAGAFLFHQLFFSALQDKNAAIGRMLTKIEESEEKARQILKEKPKLDRWRQLSLPSDIDLARLEYEKYLNSLLRKSEFPTGFAITPRPADSKSSPTVGNKVPVYTKLSYNVTGHASLASLVSLMENFYKTGLMHQIRHIQINRPLTFTATRDPRDLDVTLTIEALAITGAGNRNYLLPNLDRRLLALDAVAALKQAPSGLAMLTYAVGPTGPIGPLALAQPPRDYSAVANKNIFYGPPPREVAQDRTGPEVEFTRFVHLTDITNDSRRWEASLYDRWNNKRTRLRAEPGFDSFRVTDQEGETLIRGRVISIPSTRELVFRVDENYFGMRVGQTLEEAMLKSLTASQMKDLGLGKMVKEEGGEKANEEVQEK